MQKNLSKYSPGKGGVPKGSRAAYRHGAGKRPSSGPQLDPGYLRAAARLSEMAEARGHTAAQEALAWVLGNPMVTSVVTAASSVAQLEANVPAFDLELLPEEREVMSKAIAAEVG